MATNRQVAERFASVITRHLVTATAPMPVLRPLQGSNLKTFVDSYRDVRLAQSTDGVFTHLAVVESYSTPIAEIVYNGHAQVPELWIVAQKYSPTTHRHKLYVTQAFAERMVESDFVFSRTEVGAHIYYTEAMQHRPSCRVEQTMADQKINHSSSYYVTQKHIARTIADIDQPRIHDSTRMARLHRAMSQAQRLYDLISKDVPEGYGGVQAVSLKQQIDDTMGFLQHLMTINDIKELRIAVRGWVELEGNLEHDS